MGTFSTTAVLSGTPSMVAPISKAICEHFSNEGYSVEASDNHFGGKEISVTKGGLFKSLLGMKTALKISLRPCGENINFEAGIGIFGQQIIPTVITMLWCWPVLITQIWGLVKQAQLDDIALDIARKTIDSYKAGNNGYGGHCTNCGNPIAGSARYCPHCGTALCA